MQLTDSVPPATTAQRLHVTHTRKPSNVEIDLALRQIVRHPTGKVYRWEDDQHTWHVAFELEGRDEQG